MQMLNRYFAPFALLLILSAIFFTVENPMETLEPTVVSEPRDVPQAIFRGLRERCPACGEGRMFRAYLKVVDECPHCHTELHHHRADDAPPYFTILIVAHVVVGGILAMEQAFQPADWLQAAIWVPVTLIMSLPVGPRAMSWGEFVT